MIIRTIKHRGLQRFIETDDARELRGDLVNRIRNIIAALVAAQDMDGVQGPPGWRIHRLAGDRAGTWSIAVSGNWRITFDIEDGEIADLDLEDYEQGSCESRHEAAASRRVRPGGNPGTLEPVGIAGCRSAGRAAGNRLRPH